MQYGAGALAGMAGSALFWLINEYLLTLPRAYQIAGMLVCFIAFGGIGYWMSSRPSNPPRPTAGTRIASGLRGKNVNITVDGVATSGDKADILTDVSARENVEGKVTNIETKP